MGEVYRAKDTRLKRDVALKVLPARFSESPERIKRFQQEAESASALNHPNILAIFDIGTETGAPYIVSELLEGETLRSQLAGGPLSPRRAIGHALQIAQGLAAAHEKGIIHRDLKPENVFVTNDGHLKILDFGLAKLIQGDGASSIQSHLPTATHGTDPGTLLGTIGYMSPEQARGRPADARSDVFSLGAILYEILSGRRAFHGETSADTMTAILKEDPPDLSSIRTGIAPGLERIVRHCLEKHAEARFQSARDLAFDLEALSTDSGGTPTAASRPDHRSAAMFAMAGVAALGLAAAAFLAGRRSAAGLLPPARVPTLEPVSYGRGNVLNARFTPDGRSVVYSAAWLGRPPELFLTIPGSPESRALGLSGTDLLALSPTGELALLIKRKGHQGVVGGTGTLARMPLGGGAPREILEDVTAAGWSADGQDLVVVRNTGDTNRLEFPIGKLLYETPALLTCPKLSPDGDLVALMEQATPSFDASASRFTLIVVDRTGKRRALASFSSANLSSGVVWLSSGREILVPGST